MYPSTGHGGAARRRNPPGALRTEDRAAGLGSATAIAFSAELVFMPVCGTQDIPTATLTIFQYVNESAPPCGPVRVLPTEGARPLLLSTRTSTTPANVRPAAVAVVHDVGLSHSNTFILVRHAVRRIP